MGVSTDAQLCFGIAVGNDEEMPWQTGKCDQFDSDVEEWWMREVHKYKPPFELFDENGEWLDGVVAPDDKAREYFKAAQDFASRHPLPVDVVKHCSGDYPMYIIAVPGTWTRAHRGFPREIDSNKMSFDIKDAAALIKFCDDYGIAGEGPAWWLSSMWW